MEENEIFEEVNTEDINQNIDGTELVDSVEEVESSNTYSQDELISALLSLMNERAAEEVQEEVFSDDLIVQETEPVKVVVENETDFSYYFDPLYNSLDHFEDQLIEAYSVQTLDTPLAEYDITNILLLGILVMFIISFCYRFIKDNLLHF